MSEAGPEGLEIEVSRPSEDVVLVVLDGEMDLISSGAFGHRMAELEAGAPTHVVLDLAGVTFIDSSGINALVQAARAIEGRGGTAALAAPGSAARRVFEIARVGQVVRVAPNREEALSVRAFDESKERANDPR